MKGEGTLGFAGLCPNVATYLGDWSFSRGASAVLGINSLSEV